MFAISNPQELFHYVGESTSIDWNACGGALTLGVGAIVSIISYWLGKGLMGVLSFAVRWGIIPPIKGVAYVASLPFRRKPAPEVPPLSPLAESLLAAIAAPEATHGPNSLLAGNAEIWPDGKPSPTGSGRTENYVFVGKECADGALGEELSIVTKAAYRRMIDLRETERQTQGLILASLVRTPLEQRREFEPKALTRGKVLLDGVPQCSGK
jgi:hypothetical protein